MKKHFLPVVLLSLTLLANLRASAQAPADGTMDASSAVTIPATVDPAKAAEIRKMLDLTGTLKMMDQIKVQMFESFKTQQPGVPPEVWTRLESEMDNRELLDALIPLYDKYYSIDDLKAANAFYESPAGQHIIATKPQLMHDTLQIAQAWGRKLGMKVVREIQAAKASGGGTPAPAH